VTVCMSVGWVNKDRGRRMNECIDEEVGRRGLSSCDDQLGTEEGKVGHVIGRVANL
jgi:hypothetical protein